MQSSTSLASSPHNMCIWRRLPAGHQKGLTWSPTRQSNCYPKTLVSRASGLRSSLTGLYGHYSQSIRPWPNLIGSPEVKMRRPPRPFRTGLKRRCHYDLSCVICWLTRAEVTGRARRKSAAAKNNEGSTDRRYAGKSNRFSIGEIPSQVCRVDSDGSDSSSRHNL